MLDFIIKYLIYYDTCYDIGIKPFGMYGYWKMCQEEKKGSVTMWIKRIVNWP